MELLEGNPQPGGTYYLFDLYSDAPRTATVPLCPQVHTHWMRLEAARQ